MSYSSLKDADLEGKRVLLRAGFDVPIEKGKVLDNFRIEKIVPTMKHILDNGASLIIAAHQGRPKGKVDPKMSQKPLVSVLQKLLGVTVQFADSCTGKETKNVAESLKPGDVLLLENVRFDPRENASKSLPQKNCFHRSSRMFAGCTPTKNRRFMSSLSLSPDSPAM